MRGALFGPTLIAVSIILKVFCSTATGAFCFADQLAVPIFLPLIFVYAVFGKGIAIAHELWFVVLYWSAVGLLIGLIFDLYTLRFRYSPEQRPPL